MTPRVLLATAAALPAADDETPRVLRALEALGIDAAVAGWPDVGAPWADADLVVVRSTWDYADDPAAFLAWADDVASTTAVRNPPAVLRWNAHKGYLADLAAHGVAVLPTALVPQGAPDEAVERAAAAMGPDVVVKPAVDVGGRGARRGAPGDPGLLEHACGLVALGDVLVQPCATSIATEGEHSLVLLHGEPLLARRKVPGGGDFRVHEHHGGRTEVAPLDGELVALAEAALAATPAPVLYARADAVRFEGRLHLMELELIEPYLYLRGDDEVAAVAAAIAAELG